MTFLNKYFIEQALKSDVIDSIVARCELLCEDILQAEEEQGRCNISIEFLSDVCITPADPRVLYETPLRLFAPLRDSGLNFCDYLFIDEEISNSVERFRDLVDVIVREDEIDADTERKPGTDFFFSKLKKEKLFFWLNEKKKNTFYLKK